VPLSAQLELPRTLPIAGARRLAGRAAVSAALAAAEDDAQRRQRKQMSHAARLAAAVIQGALSAAGWTDGRETTGAFLGVGGSGAELAELTALLAGSTADGRFSLRRFGERGLGAANPLLAFQLMNNFTLCHGAIQCGLGGPSGAFFSRGAGTVAALAAAAWAIIEGQCPRAVAGGADSALHPVTLAELRRAGALGAGLVPDEGAAAVALAAEAAAAEVELVACAVLPGEHEGPQPDSALIASLDPLPLRSALQAALATAVLAASEAVVLSAAVPQLRDFLAAELHRALPRIACIERDAPGETLAAAPALALGQAIELFAHPAHGGLRQAAILSIGLDGELGVVAVRRRA